MIYTMCHSKSIKMVRLEISIFTSMLVFSMSLPARIISAFAPSDKVISSAVAGSR